LPSSPPAPVVNSSFIDRFIAGLTAGAVKG
jgi:hypothetical protein